MRSRESPGQGCLSSSCSDVRTPCRSPSTGRDGREWCTKGMAASAFGGRRCLRYGEDRSTRNRRWSSGVSLCVLCVCVPCGVSPFFLMLQIKSGMLHAKRGVTGCRSRTSHAQGHDERQSGSETASANRFVAPHWGHLQVMARPAAIRSTYPESILMPREAFAFPVAISGRNVPASTSVANDNGTPRASKTATDDPINSFRL